MPLSNDQLQLIHDTCTIEAILSDRQCDRYLNTLYTDIDAKQNDYKQVSAVLNQNHNAIENTIESLSYHRTDVANRLREAEAQVKRQTDAKSDSKHSAGSATGQTTQAQRDVKNYKKLHDEYNALHDAWMQLRHNILNNEVIPQNLQTTFNNAHANFNPINIAYMLRYEAGLRQHIRGENSADRILELVRLREACLGMTPLSKYRYRPDGFLFHFRLGKVPLGLDKLAATATAEEIRDAIRRQIENFINAFRLAMQRAGAMQNIIVVQDQQLVEQEGAINEALAARDDALVRLDQQHVVNIPLAPRGNQNQNLGPNAPLLPNQNSKNCITTKKRWCCFITFVITGGIVLTVISVQHGNNNNNDPVPVDPTLAFTFNPLGQNYNEFCIQATGGTQAIFLGAYQVTTMFELAIAMLPALSGISLFPDSSTFTSIKNSDGSFSTTITLPSAGISLADGQQACARMNTAFQGSTVNIGGLIPKNAPVFVDGTAIPMAGITNTTDPTPTIKSALDYTTWSGADATKLPVNRVNRIIYRDMTFDTTGKITANTYPTPAQLRNLQLQNPNANTEIFLHLGAYGDGDKIAQIAANTQTATTFATNAAGAVQQGFDGLSFDPAPVGATTPITGSNLVALIQKFQTAGIKKIRVIAPGNEYGLGLVTPETAWCDVAALPGVEIVRATNFAYGSNAAGKSVTDDQTAVNIDPNNPTTDRTASFTDSIARMRQLCPSAPAAKFGGTIYTDGVVTSISNTGPQNNGRWATPVTNVGDREFVTLNDLINGNYPTPNMQCTLTGENPAYSGVTQTPYCFAPATANPATYVAFTDAKSAQVLAQAAKTNGHGSISISSSSGKSADAPLDSGKSITAAVATVFAANNNDSLNSIAKIKEQLRTKKPLSQSSVPTTKTTVKSTASATPSAGWFDSLINWATKKASAVAADAPHYFHNATLPNGKQQRVNTWVNNPIQPHSSVGVTTTVNANNQIAAAAVTPTLGF